MRVTHLICSKADLESESSDIDFHSLGSLTMYRDNAQTVTTLMAFGEIMPEMHSLILTSCHTPSPMRSCR